MDRDLAFAGIFQSAYLVDKLAQHGEIAGSQLESISRSILNLQPSSVMDVYGDLVMLKSGNQQICQHLELGKPMAMLSNM